MSLFYRSIRFGLVRPFCRRHGQAIPISLSRISHRYSSYLKVEKEDSYAVMHMCKKPINSQSKAFILEMKDAILNLESDKDMQGLIITSACPKVFSAGLDLKELYQKSLDDLMDFWTAMQDTWLVLYGSRLAIIAAINGHCLAAGGVTALTSDYRIMARGPYKIGLNESKRGLVLTFWLRDLLRNTIGHREAERAFPLGMEYSPEEALRIGMVDELVDEKDLMKRAREQMATWLTQSPGTTRHECKMEMRGTLMKQLRERQMEDALQSARQFQSETLQKSIENFFEGKKK